MFGAWQAGAWSVLATRFQPDLIVGASVGSLNGYAIAAGCTPRELYDLWRRPQAAGFSQLPATVRALVEEHALEIEYAVVLVDALHMKEETFTGAQVTWRHLVASCAVPIAALPMRVGGKWYVDGGLLHVLPVPAALKLGASEILALNALPVYPVPALVPLVRGFRALFAKPVAIPETVRVTTLSPSSLRLGSLGDAYRWQAEHIERWYAQGAADAASAIESGRIPPGLWEVDATPKHFHSGLS
jgi:predicted acylesterase/phospholipase RssA